MSDLMRNKTILSGDYDFFDENFFMEHINNSESSHYYDTAWFLKFVPTTTIYALTFLLGTFGNLLVICSILFIKKLQSVTNIFLLSLASADLLLVIVCIPIKITEFFTHQWVFGRLMCKVFHYAQNFIAVCSVFNLTVMSLGKYECKLNFFVKMFHVLMDFSSLKRDIWRFYTHLKQNIYAQNEELKL
jgi:hypothetical protein